MINTLPIKNGELKDVKPTDYPHFLLWDTPNDLELNQLMYQNNAQLVSYRENLLSRINLNSRFLILHERLDQELEAIKQICQSATKPVVLLKDLDILITYLYVQHQPPISLFWKKLVDMRHLQSILWIILPNQLSPPNLNENYIIQM